MNASHLPRSTMSESTRTTMLLHTFRLRSQPLYKPNCRCRCPSVWPEKAEVIAEGIEDEDGKQKAGRASGCSKSKSPEMTRRWRLRTTRERERALSDGTLVILDMSQSLYRHPIEQRFETGRCSEPLRVFPNPGHIV